MNAFEVLALSLGVSVDVFAIALALGMAFPQINSWVVLKTDIALAFPTAFVIDMVGRFGPVTHPTFTWMGHLIAAAVLAWMGCSMIRGSQRSGEAISRNVTTRFVPLFLLGVTSSVDGGLAALLFQSYGPSTFWGFDAIKASSIIMVSCGWLIGSLIGVRYQRHAELSGGIILAGVAGSSCWF
jgi:manganese efflux pump family protein